MKIHNFRGDVTDGSAEKEPMLNMPTQFEAFMACASSASSHAVLLFSELNNNKFRYFDSENIFTDNDDNK